MGQIVVEALDTRSLSSSSGGLTGSRTFHVYSDNPAVPITEPASIKLGDGTLPRYGDLFPGEVDLYATTFQIESVPDSGYVWRVRWNYSNGGGGEVPEEPIVVQPVVPGYVTFSMEYGGQWRDAWRSGPGLTLWRSNYANQDIGGTKVDAGGEPTSVWTPQHTLVVEETVTAASMSSRSITIRDKVGKRNERAFYGASIGTLLYEGASARRVSLLAYSITHRFRYDEWLHAAQQPRMNSQRQPDVDLIGGQLHASNVRWVQPYPREISFNTLSENF
jgi:hypothetical protein